MTDRPFTAHRLPEELAERPRLLDALQAALAAVGVWERLWEALRNVGSLGPGALVPEERVVHAEALRLTERVLRQQMNDEREGHS